MVIYLLKKYFKLYNQTGVLPNCYILHNICLLYYIMLSLTNASNVRHCIKQKIDFMARKIIAHKINEVYYLWYVILAQTFLSSDIISIVIIYIGKSLDCSKCHSIFFLINIKVFISILIFENIQHKELYLDSYEKFDYLNLECYQTCVAITL